MENDVILDASVELRVVLGQTSMIVKDILGLGDGSIVELDKYANEPVEIYVNNVLFAKGEVVSVDDNFGVRITEVVKK